VRALARVLLPVLVAGALVSCSSGESDDSLPTVKGPYGEKPKVQIAKSLEPSKKLQVEVIDEGDGPAVRRGDLLVVDYLGKNMRSRKVFDNSYDRGQPAAFTLKDGPGGVISGWVDGLDGVHVGSRVLLVVPPKDGYGKQGNPNAKIKGTDSLAFVVDVIGAYGKKAALGPSTPVEGLSESLPQVAPGRDPEITVPEGTTPPTEPSVTVVETGEGAKLAVGDLAVVQFTAVSWANQPLTSTWPDGPQGVPVSADAGNPFELLEGVPVGSRVIMALPAPTGTTAEEESVAVVVDILGQHGPAKKEKQ
jgi:peptidylprolyl isomerase